MLSEANIREDLNCQERMKMEDENISIGPFHFWDVADN